MAKSLVSLLALLLALMGCGGGGNIGGDPADDDNSDDDASADDDSVADDDDGIATIVATKAPTGPVGNFKLDGEMACANASSCTIDVTSVGTYTVSYEGVDFLSIPIEVEVEEGDSLDVGWTDEEWAADPNGALYRDQWGDETVADVGLVGSNLILEGFVPDADIASRSFDGLEGTHHIWGTVSEDLELIELHDVFNGNPEQVYNFTRDH